MAEERVLRVRRIDASEDESDYVLLKVTSNGSGTLDIKIVGTEGASPFVGSIKQSKARKLRAANYQGTDREWEAVLQWTFLRKELEPEEAKLLQGVEAVASVEGEELKITLRKNISGITQRLGTIPLVQNEDEEIAPVEWALIAAKEAGDAATTISTLHAKLAEQQETVSKLNASLDDLIKAKKEHEDKLLQKFTELLNSKKLKIRDQQRLLAGAKIDSSTGKMLLIPTEVSEARDASKPGSSRRSKRKASGKAKAPVEEDDDSEGFEDAAVNKMDVDLKQESDEEEERLPQVTPEPSDTEGEDDDGPAPVPLSQSSKAKAPARAASKQPEPKEVAEPPPRRELPFARKYQKAKEEPKPAPPPEEEDETDEEL